MVFIGGMAVQLTSAKQIIDRCKTLGVKVVAGGPLFTSEPGEFGEVDHLVPLAITLSIYGYHYRKICELYIYRETNHGRC